jgi:hypothetical protein
MSKSLHRRLDAIAKALPPSLLERLEHITDEVEARQRIETWTAGPHDFETVFGPGLADVRRDLVDAAVEHRVSEWTMGPHLSDEGRPRFLAAAAIDHEPGSTRQLAAIQALQRHAEPPAERGRWVDPWDSAWAEANVYLLALGADHGAALHLAAAPAAEQARAEWEQERQKHAADIRAGTARRVLFLVWVQPDLEDRRQRLLAQALDRRTRRTTGEILELSDVSDAAAEFVSYLPDETVPENVGGLLRTCRDQHPVPGTPGHEEWVEANELYWVVGSDGGQKMRERLQAMVEEGEVTMP